MVKILFYFIYNCCKNKTEKTFSIKECTQRTYDFIAFFFLKATLVFARLVTKANLEKAVPALKEVLISTEEGVARVRGAIGDTRGEVCISTNDGVVLKCSCGFFLGAS